MTDPKKAVFLSYASKVSVAAKRICAALRSAGIEVWFDRSSHPATERSYPKTP